MLQPRVEEFNSDPGFKDSDFCKKSHGNQFIAVGTQGQPLTTQSGLVRHGQICNRKLFKYDSHDFSKRAESTISDVFNAIKLLVNKAKLVPTKFIDFFSSVICSICSFFSGIGNVDSEIENIDFPTALQIVDILAQQAKEAEKGRHFFSECAIGLATHIIRNIPFGALQNKFNDSLYEFLMENGRLFSEVEKALETIESEKNTKKKVEEESIFREFSQYGVDFLCDVILRMEEVTEIESCKFEETTSEEDAEDGKTVFTCDDFTCDDFDEFTDSEEPETEDEN
jgi:hypothetical protein